MCWLKPCGSKPCDAAAIITPASSGRVTRSDDFVKSLKIARLLEKSKWCDDPIAGNSPRCGVFEQLSQSNRDNAVHVMTEIAIQVAKLLLPRDSEEGAAVLLKRMTENRKFRQFDSSNGSYVQWTNNPGVVFIKGALTKLGNSDQPLRDQLLSLLARYPKQWLQQHFGVGRKVAMNAVDHAKDVGAGLRQVASSKLAGDRLVGHKEE
jgi:hypothetical protein